MKIVQKKLRPKKCSVKTCRKEFVPTRPFQNWCCPDCAIELLNEKKRKQKQKEKKQAREKLKTRSDWMKDAQAAFNAYIRARDVDQPCISCGRFHQGQWHAGHYRPTSTSPALRFNEDNVHKQCQPCNTHMHGNLVEYRINLIRKIGFDKLEWLEGPHEPAKYSIEDLKDIKNKYLKLVREMRKNS